MADNEDRPRSGIGMALNLGINFGVAFIGLPLLGNWLDRKYNTGIAFLIAGVILAMAYVIYELWKLNHLTEKTEEEDNEHEKK